MEKLRKNFGAQSVVKDLDLTVQRGEFVSLLGPSGCGKTTTLRMIAGFMDPDGGQIFIEDQRIDGMPSQKRGTAMVFQNYALFPHMTVFDNVAFGLRMHKVPKDEIKARVDQVLALVHLSGTQGKYPKQLSGGQQQRVALARSLVLNPKILLLDEPLSNLDAKLRKQLRVELREIQKQAGITTVLVTHDLEEAFSLSDKVAVMNGGRLEQFGTPLEIFSKPATRFVADFVGHTNLVQGVVKARTGEGAVVEAGGLELRAAVADAAHGTVTLSIPPHLIRVSSDRLPVDNCFGATIKHVSYLGASVQVMVKVGELTLTCDLHATEDLSRLHSGAEVFVGWRSGDAIYIANHT